MKYTASTLVAALLAAPVVAFAPICISPTNNARTSVITTTQLQAEIRPKSDKAAELRFGWDGTTALGGAVENAAPARMLADIRAAGETIPDDCQVFNANVEMDADSLKFEDVIALIDTHYESQLLEFKNGNMLNKQGENEGSAKILSYAALSNMDQATTLKVSKQTTINNCTLLTCIGLTLSYCLFVLVCSSGDNITERSWPTPMGMIIKTFETLSRQDGRVFPLKMGSPSHEKMSEKVNGMPMPNLGFRKHTVHGSKQARRWMSEGVVKVAELLICCHGVSQRSCCGGNSSVSSYY
jgi:HopJ type III effector protein